MRRRPLPGKAGLIITDGGGRAGVNSAVSAHPPTGAPLIQCDGAGFAYPGAAADAPPAIADIDLCVRAGEFVAVLGGNGSGKSTLARLLNGLLQPTRGCVRVAGLDTREPGHLPEVRRRVGLVFQNPDNQIVAAAVEDDVAFGPENLGLPPDVIAARVRQALDAVGLAEYARSDPHHLSGGQKQRVAIAGVLAMQPDCLCLDEPTSLLDPAGRREVRQALGRLRSAGCALVLITHDAEEAAEADRVIVLHRGRIAAEGHPRRVFAHPDRLLRWGVEPPPGAAAWAALRARGAVLGPTPLTVEELAAQVATAMGCATPPTMLEAGAADGAAPPAGEPSALGCAGVPSGEAGAAVGRSVTAVPASAPAEETAPVAEPGHGPGRQDGIRLERVRYAFEDPGAAPGARRPALDGIDLSLRPGECLALLGATGSGKSTVALHCCALLQPQAGAVSIDGIRPWAQRRGPVRNRALRACRRRVGMVFQYPEDQFFEERVLDEVAFAPRNHGASLPEAEAAARQALARVGLPAEYADRSPLQLSGGEMRRVAIASLLAARPNYLILDEPSAGLDAPGRADLAALIRDLKASGIGILLITHRMEEAAALADRVAVLHAGRIVAAGTPREVFARGAALAKWGLSPPAATEWLLCLRRWGGDVPAEALTMEEALRIVGARLGLTAAERR